MAKFRNKPSYSVFAEFYDRIADTMRGPNRRAREEILGPKMLGIQSACDLCCGTGTTALELARLLVGRKVGGQTPPPRTSRRAAANRICVYAVDASPRMLAVARSKFAAARLPRGAIQAIHADMRTFRLPEPVDLITCEFDAINHLVHKRDLESVARAVARALKPGGRFLFDANNTKAFKELWVGSWVVEGRGFFMATRGGYDARRDKGWTVLDWFLPLTASPSDVRSRIRPSSKATKSAGWRRFTERYEEVAWTENEICRALRAAGLRVAGHWDLTHFSRCEPWAKTGCRTYWLARKGRS
jgi:SAM-dependent methyltransferase